MRQARLVSLRETASIRAKILWRDPEYRGKQLKDRQRRRMTAFARRRDRTLMAAQTARQTMLRLQQSPEFRERQRKGKDALSPEQRAEVLKAIQSGQSTYDIANDWLIAPSTVRGIKHKEKHR